MICASLDGRHSVTQTVINSHIKGVSKDKRNAFPGAEGGEPVPGEEAFDAHNQMLAVGCNGLEKRVRSGWHMPVYKDLAILVQDTEGHGAGMQVNATVKFVLFGVESHEVSSSLASEHFSQFSIPRWYAEEGASISIKALQPTPSSVRCAPASRRG
jgi:hypothetical protein